MAKCVDRDSVEDLCSVLDGGSHGFAQELLSLYLEKGGAPGPLAEFLGSRPAPYPRAVLVRLARLIAMFVGSEGRYARELAPIVWRPRPPLGRAPEGGPRILGALLAKGLFVERVAARDLEAALAVSLWAILDHASQFLLSWLDPRRLQEGVLGGSYRAYVDTLPVEGRRGPHVVKIEGAVTIAEVLGVSGMARGSRGLVLVPRASLTARSRIAGERSFFLAEGGPPLSAPRPDGLMSVLPEGGRRQASLDELAAFAPVLRLPASGAATHVFGLGSLTMLCPKCGSYWRGWEFAPCLLSRRRPIREEGFGKVSLVFYYNDGSGEIGLWQAGAAPYTPDRPPVVRRLLVDDDPLPP